MAVSLKNRLTEVSYLKLLQEATTKEGRLSKCYQLFHTYSLLNTLSVLFQMEARGMEISPIKTFNGWKSLNRSVNKGEKALAVLFPVFAYFKQEDENGKITYNKVLRGFETKKLHFALTQTHGETVNFNNNNIYNINVASLIKHYGIKQIPFSTLNGNTQGFCYPDKLEIAINPIAENPIKTFVHELAHCLLHADTTSKGIQHHLKEVEAEAVAYLVLSICNSNTDLSASRGYIQSWLADDKVDETTAKRIFKVADDILKVIKADTEGMAN